MSLPQAHLVIIGLGATGCALLPLVSTYPFHRITLIDGDTIEEANLVRQPLYGMMDLGRPKCEVAMERVSHLHPAGRLVSQPIFVDAANINSLLHGASLVADCTDDIHVKGLLDRTCEALCIPLVTGSVHGRQLQVMTLHDQRQPLSLRSFFPGRTGVAQDGCDMRKVPITVPAMAAVLMARRIMALITGDDDRYLREMDLVDVHHGSWMRIAPPSPPGDHELLASLDNG